MSKMSNHNKSYTNLDELQNVHNPVVATGGCFELMTESEVILFLRIPEVSKSQNHHNVIEHLKKYRGLPRIHICHKALYPRKAVLEWLERETDVGK